MSTLFDTELIAGILRAVPFLRLVGAEVTEVICEEGPVTAVAELPDHPDRHNHVSGPHAGATFTLGETAAAAVVLAAFGAYLDRMVPLVVRAEIAYYRLAMGTLHATAILTKPVGDIVRELERGIRPEFAVDVDFVTADGTVTATMIIVWTLKSL